MEGSYAPTLEVCIRHHYSVVVKTFASGAEVPLWSWVRIRTPVGAEVGATVLQTGDPT